MTSWLKRSQAGIQSAPTTAAPISAPGWIPTNTARFRDPNAPDARLDVESRCIYERRLPGNAYITAHITRLQDGFYDSPSTHGDTIENVRFLAVSFVFHPSETINRFQAATVSIAVHDDTDQTFSDPPQIPGHRPPRYGPRIPRRKPKFLRFAPHVMFGGVSPETLDWNFNLTGSLGVAQTPVTASLSPSGGLKGSYKLYQMMRIQGSTRTLLARHRHEYDIEDGEVVWTMEENPLQKSGLPREMTFVMLITKGDVENVVFDINIEPKVASWFGHYPGWWTRALKYQPLMKEPTDLDRDLGQKFEPIVPGRGFNFANLAASFNNFVSLPGTAYTSTDQDFANQVPISNAGNTSQPTAAPVSKTTKPAGGQQPAPGQQAQSGPPAQSQSSQPQQPAQQSKSQSDEPMDYHIYLHNPRSINLHATPPPPSTSAPPQTSVSNWTSDLSAANVIPRPKTTLPERTKSPANTKSKRRSIDISNMANSLTPSQSRTEMRKISPGSLRRSSSRTNLRSSPLVEDSHSEHSQISSHSGKENLSPPQIPSPPHSASPDEVLIPLKAPSPPHSSAILSPPLPVQRRTTKNGGGEKLPFELSQPVRPTVRRNHSGSASRTPRARDSPSPLRTRREVTPSPNENDDPMEKLHVVPTTNKDTQQPSQSLKVPIRRERNISPYGGMVNGTAAADARWDEARGDLKQLRARKRYSMPADGGYSYITGSEADADRDWEDH